MVFSFFGVFSKESQPTFFDDRIVIVRFVGGYMLRTHSLHEDICPCAASAVVPDVMTVRTGTPCASATECHFVFTPLRAPVT